MYSPIYLYKNIHSIFDTFEKIEYTSNNVSPNLTPYPNTLFPNVDSPNCGIILNDIAAKLEDF